MHIFLDVQLIDTITGETMIIESMVLPGIEPKSTFPWMMFMIGSTIAIG